MNDSQYMEEEGIPTYEHLEELNHALEVERELVLKAHENYKNLKKKYIELKEERETLQNELETKLLNQNHRIESLAIDRDKLAAENEALHGEILKLKEDFKESAKEMKKKEEAMKKEFSDQIEELLEHSSTSESEQIEDEKEKFRKALLLDRDDRVQQLQDEIRRVQAACDEEVRLLRAELSDERRKRIELTAIAQRTRADLDLAKSLIATKQSEFFSVRSELNRRLNEQMEKEVSWMSQEENFRKLLLSRTTSFDQKVDDFQRIVGEKDELIAGLRRQLDSLQTSAASETHRSNRLKAENENEKDSSKLWQGKNEANQALIEQLKSERNQLEITVAELKKNLATSPETTLEVKRLKGLLEEKEEKLNNMRRTYRQLVRKVEHSLVNLERQQIKTKRKIEENLMS